MGQPKIVMYLTDWCPYCARARGLLDRKGVTYETINIDERPEARAEMMARSGRRSVPQIFIGDKHVGGSDDLYALDADGGLVHRVAGHVDHLEGVVTDVELHAFLERDHRRVRCIAL